jgi:hypothetical protein
VTVQPPSTGRPYSRATRSAPGRPAPWRSVLAASGRTGISGRPVHPRQRQQSSSTASGGKAPPGLARVPRIRLAGTANKEASMAKRTIFVSDLSGDQIKRGQVGSHHGQLPGCA